MSASNAGQLLGKWAVISVGVTDLLKGVLPVLAAVILDLSLAAQVAVGLAAVAGHNWSVFLGFEGGRGLSSAYGVMLIVAPVEVGIFTLTALFGLAFYRNTPLVIGLSAALTPVWSAALHQEAPILWGTSLMVGIIVAKRLMGNRLGPLPAEGKAKLFLCRLALDRDTNSRVEWVQRAGLRPEGSGSR